MKRLLLLMLALSLLLAQAMRADKDNPRKKNKHQTEAVMSDQSRPPAPKAQQPVKQAPSKTASAKRPLAKAPGSVAPTQRMVSNPPRSVAPARRTATRVPRPVTPAVKSQPVKSEAQLDGRTRQRTKTTVQTKQGKRHVDRNSYYTACHYVVHTPHNRNWWRSRYNTAFILFSGGYYYWWNNYWYPAYGYDPYYNNYIYSEPIYGYNNLAPGQVIQNVQLALRDSGYYPGAIDGLIGPQTRAALAAFQRDHGLIVTSAVDEPTLVTLGLA